MVRFGRMTVLVRDLDEAKAFYVDALGLSTLFDDEVAPGLRTVHLGADGERGAGVWLLKATPPESLARVGRQTGGEPAMVMYTDDLVGDLERLARMDIAPLRPTVTDAAGSMYAHLRDVSGNEIVLVQLPPVGVAISHDLVE